ncbi:hypothetical protein HDV00_012324 [Rhizophlyctis rosea]|nr:hypothetical protein HDV00_012324 [Rhizophlyctis rosea]
MTYNAVPPPDATKSSSSAPTRPRASSASPSPAQEEPTIATPAQQVSFANAIERAKAIAARLTADAKASGADKAPPPTTPDTPTGTKRPLSSLDERPPPPPSSGYRREDRERRNSDDHSSKRQATDSSYPFSGGSDSYSSSSSRARPGLGAPGAPAAISGGSGHYGPGPSGRKIEFNIPTSMVGLVIGRGGENMKKIESDFKVRIQFATAQPGEQERLTTITGGERDVEAAKENIMAMIQSGRNGPGGGGGYGGGGGVYGGGGGMGGSGATMITVEVPHNKVGLIIGRGGETIHSLQDQSGAKIAVTPDGQGQQSPMRIISLTGTQQAVDMAKGLIEELVHSMPPGRGGGMGGGGAPGGYGPQEIIQVHTDRVGLIIGRGGETVKSIQMQCGVKINIDSQSLPDGNRNVTIVGPQDRIEMAKEMIYERIMPRGRDGSWGGGGGGGGGGYGSGGGGGYGQDWQQQQQGGGYDQQAWGGQQQHQDPNAWAGYDQSAAGYDASAAGYDASQQQAGYDQGAYGGAAAAGGGDAAPGSYDQAAYQQAWEEYYKQYGDWGAQYAAQAGAEGTAAPGVPGAEGANGNASGEGATNGGVGGAEGSS